MGIFLARAQRIARFHHSLREFTLSFFHDKNLPFLCVPFFTFLMVLALIFSGSRGGMMALAISFFFYLFLMTTLYKGRSLKIGMFLLLIIILLACFWMSYGQLGDFLIRFQTLGGHFQARDSIWKDSMAMASDFKLLGIGLGAYQYILPRYFFESHLSEYIHHAHNEYIEILCEAGLLGLFILILGGALTCSKVLFKRDLLKWGILTGVISVSLHNLVDFNLRIPANALLYILLFALLQIQGEGRSMH
jgi:O-antigen ligase